MAAIAGSIDANLGAGGTTRVSGTSWFKLKGGADKFEKIVTGDGNDKITGNTLGNHLMGMRGSDTLTGLGGNDILDGGKGKDVLNGGADNDTYVLGSESDQVGDTSGIDTITSTINRSLAGYASIENLKLLGTARVNGSGNDLANVITGNAADNVLDGGRGKDTLIGGSGNDTYVLGSESDSVGDSSGRDTITSTSTRSLAAYKSIENLKLLGTAHIKGSGNDLANEITGNSGNNSLDGGKGKDKLVGGAGNDTYVLGSEYDTVSDSKGTDTITSTVTRSLAGYATIENLTLLGSANINGSGNGLGNIVKGNAGSNLLNGGLGNDVLSGGAGKDTFVFNSTLNASQNIDRIGDFSAKDDTINLENGIFKALSATGKLIASAFVANTSGKAMDTKDHIIYETDTGRMLYDADGSGKGGAIQFAVLDHKPTLSSSDFFVV